jgi:hypothetical protein
MCTSYLTLDRGSNSDEENQYYIAYTPRLDGVVSRNLTRTVEQPYDVLGGFNEKDVLFIVLTVIPDFVLIIAR